MTPAALSDARSSFSELARSVVLALVLTSDTAVPGVNAPAGPVGPVGPVAPVAPVSP